MSMFELVAKIISEESNVPIGSISPETNIIRDLGIDSLALLDMVFRLEQELKMVVPVQRWLADVAQRGMPAENYFVVSALCANLEALSHERVAG
jgi:acyl carrier protein